MSLFWVLRKCREWFLFVFLQSHKPYGLCKHTIAKTTVYTATVLEKWSSVGIYFLCICLGIYFLCISYFTEYSKSCFEDFPRSIFKSYSLGRKAHLLCHDCIIFQWLGSKSDVTSAFIILSLFPTFVFYKFFSLHIFLTMTEFCRVMCGNVRGRWVFDLDNCAAKSHYHGIFYAGEIVFVLFHLGSELWLGSPALAELKLCSRSAARGLAALCLCCASHSWVSETHLVGEV